MHQYFIKHGPPIIYNTCLRNKCKCGKGYELCKILTPCCVHRILSK